MENEINLLDKNFQIRYILDNFTSLIWVIRYSAYGDFEIYTGMTDEIKNLFKEGYYLTREDSDRCMIIEGFILTSDLDTGHQVIIQGRSLESILDRRIVWSQTLLDGYLEGQVEKLLNQNAISPSLHARKIPGLVFKYSGDPRIEALKIQAQFTGDNLYEAIKSICEAFQLGFKITLNNQNQFVFELYMGEDRSYAQEINPYVVFSPSFDNLIDSSYVESKTSLKTVTLVGGEGEGSDRKMLVTGDNTSSGLERRELFTDARDISSTTVDGELTTSEYSALLKQRGDEKLSEYREIKSFEGESETSILYRYGEDFFIGDIVQVENEFGFGGRNRVVEFIQSIDDSGQKAYPTFENVEEKGE